MVGTDIFYKLNDWSNVKVSCMDAFQHVRFSIIFELNQTNIIWVICSLNHYSAIIIYHRTQLIARLYHIIKEDNKSWNPSSNPSQHQDLNEFVQYRGFASQWQWRRGFLEGFQFFQSSLMLWCSIIICCFLIIQISNQNVFILLRVFNR